MSSFPIITTMDKWQEILQISYKQPVLLMKHSTQCPISTMALTEVEQFQQTEEAKDVHIVMVHVIENRSISNEIADYFQIKHESPQVLWIQNGQVIWHASHMGITEERLKQVQTDDSVSS